MQPHVLAVIFMLLGLYPRSTLTLRVMTTVYLGDSQLVLIWHRRPESMSVITATQLPLIRTTQHVRTTQRVTTKQGVATTQCIKTTQLVCTCRGQSLRVTLSPDHVERGRRGGGALKREDRAVISAVDV